MLALAYWIHLACLRSPQCRTLLYQPTYLSAQVKLSQSLPPVYLTARNYHVSHVYPAFILLRRGLFIPSFYHIYIFGSFIPCFCHALYSVGLFIPMLVKFTCSGYTLLVLCFIVGVIYTILYITVWRYLSVKQSLNLGLCHSCGQQCCVNKCDHSPLTFISFV